GRHADRRALERRDRAPAPPDRLALPTPADPRHACLAGGIDQPPVGGPELGGKLRRQREVEGVVRLRLPEAARPLERQPREFHIDRNGLDLEREKVLDRSTPLLDRDQTPEEASADGRDALGRPERGRDETAPLSSPAPKPLR